MTVTERAAPGSTAERRRQIAAVSVTMSGVLPVFLSGALRVQIDRDFDFSPGRLGIASGVFFAAAALGSAVMGRLAERFGPGRAMRLAAIGSAVLLAAMSRATSFGAMLPILVLAGLGNALAQVSSNLLIAKGVHPTRQGWSLALKQAGVPAGTLLGGLAVPVLGVTVGWEWAYVAAALLAVGAAFVVPTDAVSPGAPGRQPRTGDVPLGPLVVLATAAGLAAGANGSLAAFVVSAGVESGLGESPAGLVLMAGSMIGISVRLLAGALADRRGGRHLPVVARLLAGGFIGYALLAPTTVPTHLVGAAVAFGAGWAWPGLFNLAVVTLNPGAPATATGITQTGVYVGALSGPIVFGALVETSGYTAAWGFTAVCTLLASAGMVLGRSRVLAWRATTT